jgi:hypothetical protein
MFSSERKLTAAAGTNKYNTLKGSYRQKRTETINWTNSSSYDITSVEGFEGKRFRYFSKGKLIRRKSSNPCIGGVHHQEGKSLKTFYNLYRNQLITLK